MDEYDKELEEVSDEEQENDEEAPAWIIWLMDRNLDIPFILVCVLLMFGLLGGFYWVVIQIAKP